MAAATRSSAAAVAAVERLVDERGASAGSTCVVAVDGPSGSGKTTLAAAVGARLGCPVVHMDDLYPGWGGLEDAVPRLAEWVLEPLAAGRRAGYRRFDWDAGAYAEWHDVPAHPVLVVEGVASAARRCRRLVAVVVWVDAPPDVRMARGMQRDGEAYRPHWRRWADAEEAHFAAEGTQGAADVRLTTG